MTCSDTYLCSDDDNSAAVSIIRSMLEQCWPIIFDADPTLCQHCLNVSCLLGSAFLLTPRTRISTRLVVASLCFIRYMYFKNEHVLKHWYSSKHDTLEQPTGHTTLLRRWINVNDVDSKSQQRRVPSGKDGLKFNKPEWFPITWSWRSRTMSNDACFTFLPIRHIFCDFIFVGAIRKILLKLAHIQVGVGVIFFACPR